MGLSFYCLESSISYHETPTSMQPQPILTLIGLNFWLDQSLGSPSKCLTDKKGANILSTLWKCMVYFAFSWAFLSHQAQQKILGVRWQLQVVMRHLEAMHLTLSCPSTLHHPWKNKGVEREWLARWRLYSKACFFMRFHVGTHDAFGPGSHGWRMLAKQTIEDESHT